MIFEQGLKNLHYTSLRSTSLNLSICIYDTTIYSPLQERLLLTLATAILPKLPHADLKVYRRWSPGRKEVP